MLVDIKGYEGKYQVSDDGRVFNLTVKKYMTPQDDGRGYLFIGLSNQGKRKFFKIHRLVAQAFIPNPDNLPEVNHKDEDKHNNCVDNLEWCDVRYNRNYGTRNQKIKEHHASKRLDKSGLTE